MTEDLRSLAPPARWRRGRDPRGYAIPWFATVIDGVPDFRVVEEATRVAAVRRNLCWLCGDRLGRFKAFVIGPMCAINRTTSEPPSHVECAEYAVRVCPFLTRPQARRRPGGVPEDATQPGFSLPRNPGVTLLWVATTYRTFRAADVVPAGVVLTSPAGVEVAPRGWLITIGEPVRVTAYAEGRIATLDELMASIASGLPTLTALAEAEGAVDAFTQQATTAVQALVRLVAATGTQAQEAP